MIEKNLSSLLTLTLIIGLQLSGYSGEVNFRDNPATATVLLNFCTSLSCTANVPYPSSIVWQLNGGVIVPDGASIVASYDSIRSGRSELIIAAVAYKDAGNYTCLALDSSNTVIISSQSAEITVLGPPTFEPPLSAIVVQQGDTAIFQCDVVSNPPSTISWLYEHGNHRLPLNSSGRVIISPANLLTITNVQERDAGYYVCTAENNFGPNRTIGRLILETSVQAVEVIVAPSEPDPLEVLEGNGFTLRCTVTTNASVSSISWTTQSGQDLTGVSQSSNFLLLSVLHATLMDTDLYICTATDSSGRSSSQSIEVVISRPPTFLREPADVTGTINMPLNAEVACIASGHPLPVLTWLDPNLLPIATDQVTQSPLIAAGGTLTRAHTGVYACLATNSAGEIRSQFTITVEAPPLFMTSLPNVTTPPGHDVTFSCVADGLPLPTYSWTRVGGDLPPNSLQSGALGQDLRLFDVASVLSGTYQCTATNDLGSSTATAGLIVLELPRILTATTSLLITEVGSCFSLNCNSSGPPEMELNWYFNGTRLDPISHSNLVIETNGTLSVSHADVGYSGVYMCNVSTSFAFATAEVHVIVGVQPLIVVPPVDRDLTPGSGIVLDCVATGVPNPHSSWFHTNFISGQREELGVVGSSHFQLSSGLQLVDVGRNESGVYECLMENALGEASAKATVRVEASPVVSSIFPSTIVAGDNATIICSASFNYPPGNISWSRDLNGDPLPTDRFSVDREGALQISPVMVEDVGSLTCSVTNQYGRDSFTTDIQVQFAPLVSITSGSTVEAILNNALVLSCDVRGEPHPSTSWFFPGSASAAAAGSKGKVGISRDEGTLTIVGVDASDGGTYVCRAANLHGNASDMADVTVVGPAVPGLSVVPRSENRTSVQVKWNALDSATQKLVDIYEVWTVTHSRKMKEVISHNRLGFLARQAILWGLSAGTTYKVSIRAVFQGLLGLTSGVLTTTEEDEPSGPPQNFTVTSVDMGAILEWLPPAEAERNGVILSYDVEYRLVLAGGGGAFTLESSTRMSQPPGKAILYNLSGLEERRSYEVKLSARTSVGAGPATPIQTFAPLQEFRPLDTTLSIAIAVGAGAGGVALTAMALLTLVLCCCHQRRARKGQHKPQPLGNTSTPSQQAKKKSKVVSGCVSEITLQMDSSIQGKFRVPSQHKVGTKWDVATPTTSVGGMKDATLTPPTQDGSSESGGYSEISGYAKTPPILRSDQDETGRMSDVSDQLYEELDYVEAIMGNMLGGSAPESSNDELFDCKFPSQQCQQGSPYSPAHVERSVELNTGRDDTGRDDPQLLYASVSKDHVQNKRKKRLKERLVLEASESKKRVKMQEKMKREMSKVEKKEMIRRLKEENKEKKIQEAERKKRAKDQQWRESMGLSNIVSYQDMDFSKSVHKLSS